MFITIITDCFSENDKARQATRFAGLFGITPTIVGVDAGLGLNATLEASGNLVDTFDAAGNGPGIIVVNVAPRGDKKDGTNGTHFSYFYYKNILVISTIKGFCLSLVKKFKLAKTIKILDTVDVLEFAEKQKLITKELKEYIVNSQFRSFDFVPRVAKWLTDNVSLPHSRQSLSTINEPPSAIWFVDSFGNCKTTLLASDLPLKVAPLKVKTNIGTFNLYNRLKDLPFGATAFYIGSSGIDDKRFIEIATQGIPGSAARTLKLKVGNEIKIE